MHKGTSLHFPNTKNHSLQAPEIYVLSIKVVSEIRGRCLGILITRAIVFAGLQGGPLFWESSNLVLGELSILENWRGSLGEGTSSVLVLGGLQGPDLPR